MNKLKGDKQENQFKLDEKEKIVKQLTEENNLLNANLSKLSYGYEALSESKDQQLNFVTKSMFVFLF